MERTLIGTRTAVAADEAFLRELFAHTHFGAAFGPPAAEPVWATLLEVQYRARTASWAERFPDGEDRIVSVAGDDVGRVWTAPERGALRVVDIAVWPRAQGRGIGTAVLDGLKRSAPALVLTVASGSRAADWYRRLGFREEAADLMYTAMRWTAG